MERSKRYPDLKTTEIVTDRTSDNFEEGVETELSEIWRTKSLTCFFL